MIRAPSPNPVVIAPVLDRPGHYSAYRALCPEYPFAWVRPAGPGQVAVMPDWANYPYGRPEPEYTALFGSLADALGALLNYASDLWDRFDPNPRSPGNATTQAPSHD